MARSNYDECLRRLLAHEGGYTNHPSDPGGPTNFGITIFDYRKYVKPNATAADVRAMKIDEAKAIYRAKYWAAQRCDDLPPGVDDSVFDYGVNSGIGRSGKVLRRVVGLPDNTSVINDEVLRAVAKRDAKAIIVAINDERLRFLKGLKTWPVFGAGWGRRVSEVKAFSLQLADRPGTSVGADGACGPAGGAGARQGRRPRAEGAEGRHHQGRASRWRGRRHRLLGLDRRPPGRDGGDCRARPRARSAAPSTR